MSRTGYRARPGEAAPPAGATTRPRRRPPAFRRELRSGSIEESIDACCRLERRLRAPVSGLNCGFSYSTPPAFSGFGAGTRGVEVEFSFTPNVGNGNTWHLRATFQVLRPPLVRVHGP
jgi:hypothetical protein